MSTDNNSLTPSQLQQVTALLEKAKQDLISSVTTAFHAQQEQLMATAKKEIDEAVAKNQRVVLATVQEGVEKETTRNKDRAWELLKLILPLIATALLGFFVWKWQSGIQEKIDHKTEEVKSELAVKQELYKRKLDVYHDVLNQMADVDSKIRAAEANSGKREECWSVLLKFNETVKSKRLYMSNDAYKALLELWEVGANVLRKESTLADLKAKNSEAEDKIVQDLGVKNLGKLTGSK